MPKKNILEKIVRKDYNNVLEKVIETKDFDEDVKNLLLDILYKIDVSYKDYKNVKRNTESKQIYVEKIIKTIEDSCSTIKLVKPNSKEAEELGNKTFSVDKEKQEIICYPVERKLLYSISKIGKQEEILKSKYFLINKTISDMINIGDNINTVEPLRDFNGWSWTTIRKEIENISYNLIYQNLIILLGEQFVNSWITNTEYVIDYYDEFQNDLSEKFGIELKEKLIDNLEKLSILLEIEVNPEYTKLLKQLSKENEEKLLEFQDNQAFIEKLTQDKKDINKQIRKIEKILSDKEELAKEYNNQKEEIFSIKLLENKLKQDRNNLLENLEEKNQFLNPKKFIVEKTKLERRKELLKIAEIKDKSKEKNKLLKELQKIFLQCFLVFINKAETKEEIINLIYILRYYNFLPFNEKIDIKDNKELIKTLDKVKNQLLRKAFDFKILDGISDNIEENILLYQYIFQTRIISIENIYISIKREKEEDYIQFSEDNEEFYQEKYKLENIKQQNLNIKLNKRIKIFI